MGGKFRCGYLEGTLEIRGGIEAKNVNQSYEPVVGI